MAVDNFEQDLAEAGGDHNVVCDNLFYRLRRARRKYRIWKGSYRKGPRHFRRKFRSFQRRHYRRFKGQGKGGRFRRMPHTYC